MRRLIAAIRDNDERKVEEAVLQLARTRKIFAPLALAVGAFVMLFNGLRLLVTNWRLMLVQALPAMWIWAATYDLKAKVLRGEQFHDIRGPVVLALFAAVVAITIAAFYLNAAFAFAISQPGSPDLRAGFGQARTHLRAVTGWGTGVGLALAVATMLAPRWGLGWFALLLGIVLAVMMVCYVAVPARIVGMRTAKPATTAQSGRGAKLAAAAVTGLFGAIVCTPPYAIARGGIIPPRQQHAVPARGGAAHHRPDARSRGHRRGQGHQGQRQAAGGPVPADARRAGVIVDLHLWRSWPRSGPRPQPGAMGPAAD